MFVGINVFPSWSSLAQFSATLFGNWLYTSVFQKFAFHKLLNVILLKSLRRYYCVASFSWHLFCSLINITLQNHMMLLVKNLKCFTAKYISRLNIHYYRNHRYKSYIITLKPAIPGKSLISAGLDIYRIQHFVFDDKILQIYQQHWVRKLCRHVLSECRQISKKWGGGCYTLHLPPPAWHALVK